MATTTPNFGWPVPTSTDLVKNGATAIEALGDAIDASLVDLEGGTTGQVLAKASNTDMDFSWVTTDDANAIQNAIVNAKGDIIGASANDVPAITSVGNNGEALYADSSAAAGLRYVATPAASNPVINSAFNVWQRGTTGAMSTGTGAGYLADRWYAARSGFAAGGTVSRQLTGDTTNLPSIYYCSRVSRDVGNTSTAAMFYFQTFETINSIPFVGKTITFSFYARAGATLISSSQNTITGLVYSGTAVDQGNYPDTAITGQATVASSTATLTATWQRFTATGTVGSSAKQLFVGFSSAVTGTAGATDYYEVTGVQIDVGSVALPFRTAGVSYQEELAMCQRYYQKSYPQGIAPANNINTTYGTGVGMNMGLAAQVANGGTVGSNRGWGQSRPFPVTMRTTPTVRFWDSLGNLSKYSAYGTDGNYISGNNSLDLYGLVSAYDFSITIQTVAASANDKYALVMWEASAEL